MNASSMRVAATCALLATTCLSTFVLATPALAQNADTPSAYKNIDENGVDLTDGSFNFSMVEGSIGSGEGLLSLIRYDAGGSSLDNWEGLALRIEGGSATVLLGDRSETFVDNGAGFVAEQGNGATLTGGGSAYTYRDARGTEIAFASPTSASCGAGVCDLPALKIREPNGKTVSLTWEAAAGGRRLLEVSNNLGYAMRVAYRAGGIVNGQVTDAWFDRASVTFRNTVQPGSPTPTVTYATPTAGVTEITTAGGRTWRITTDAQGRVTGIKRPGATGDSTQVVYGANGVSQVTQGGVVTNYSRTVNGSSTATVVSDALGARRTIMSNLVSGRPTQVTDALGFNTLYSYDGNDRLTEVTATEGNKRINVLDARGNALTVIARAKTPADGSATLPDIVTQAGYDATCANAAVCNQPRWTQDANGARTDYSYNDVGDVTSILSPAPTAGAVRPETRYTYAPIAAPGGGTVSMPRTVSTCQTQSVCGTSANEVLTTILYEDPNLLPTAVATGAGDESLTARTAMRYDAIGNMTHVDGPLAGPADTTRAYYNASREVVGTIGPDPDGPLKPDGTGPLKHRAQQLFRNADGDVTLVHTGTATGQGDDDLSRMTALDATHIGYDAHRRPVYQSHDSAGVVTSASQTAYDARGRVECVTQRMDPAKYTALPPSACYGQYPPGPYGYDRITRFSYDAADRVTVRTLASGLGDQADEVAATYTPNGQVQTLVDANANKTTYRYDGHDRLTRTEYPVATPGAPTSNAADYEALTYDARSLVVSMRLRDGKTIGLTYDALGRLTRKDVPKLAFFENDDTFVYDNLGRLTSAANSAGLSIAFGYDALGRKISEVNNWYGTTRSAYDLAGRRTRLTWRHDPSRDSGDPFAVDYAYMVTGEMASIKEGTGASLATFSYDDRGRRTKLTRGNGTSTSYAYDEGSRLRILDHDLTGTAHDTQLSFAYNPASQIVENGRSNDVYNIAPTPTDVLSGVNGLNQLTNVADSTLTHDARGNLVRRTGKPGAFDTYGYTTENRLAVKGYSRTTGDVTAIGTNTQLAYDPLGRLIHLDGSTTDFRYEGSEVIEETTAFSGAPRKRFVHGPGVDEPLVVYDASGAKRWFHADERGSIIATSDANGNAASVHRYDEYGIPQDALGDRFGYTGQIWLPEVGVYSYKARMYDPTIGRFLQSDPIGYEAGMNLYAYVGADPVNFTDPSGLEEEIVIRAKRLPRPEPTPSLVQDVDFSGFLDRLQRSVARTLLPECFTSGAACTLGDAVEGAAMVIPVTRAMRALYKAYRRTCGCLEAGTLVATPAGLVAIEEIAVGDLVLAHDERTGKIAAKPVTDLIRPEPKRLYALSARDVGGEAETFHATDDHPWKVQGKGWVETLALKPGDRVDTADGGDLVVTALTATDRIEHTYNLTVAEWHTFLVGEDGAVVHNVDCRKRIPGQSGKEAAKDVPSWAKGQAPMVGENGRQFAQRLMDAKYGPGRHPNGARSEFQKIQKFGDRGFE